MRSLLIGIENLVENFKKDPDEYWDVFDRIEKKLEEFHYTMERLK